MLTDVQYRNAKTDDKPLKLNDGKGLYLEVRPNGSSSGAIDTKSTARRTCLQWGTITNSQPEKQEK